MARDLQNYHYVWLEAHPHRTEFWLRDILSDGFHIHHMDGNHENNNPKNLVLIEGRDHFMLHSGGRPGLRSGGGRRSGPRFSFVEAPNGQVIKFLKGERRAPVFRQLERDGFLPERRTLF